MFWILLRWRQYSRIDINTSVRLNWGDWLTCHKTSGASNADTNADSDEILVTRAVSSQISNAATPVSQLKPTRTPKYVATPLPPLRP